jgi:GGDEF domain-containing protein
MPKVVQFAERLRVLVSRLNVDCQGVNIQVSASFGVASVDEIAMVSPVDPNVADTDRLFALTDHRLYRAKQTGRNRIVYD